MIIFKNSISYLLLSIVFYSLNDEISLLNIVLIGIGTFISLILVLKIRHNYFNKIIKNNKL